MAPNTLEAKKFLFRTKLGSGAVLAVIVILIQTTTVRSQSSTTKLPANISSAANTVQNSTSASPLNSTSSLPESTTVRIGPRASETNGSNDEPGLLCESDNDLVGQELGCSCNILNGRIKVADCSHQYIGANNTLQLQMLNISNQVVQLDLSYNRLHKIDENTFGKCDSLQYLSLRRNRIRTVTGLSCINLLKLDLSYNGLHNLTNEAFQNLPQLSELDLSYNHLVIVEPKSLDRLTNLKVLNLAYNPLGDELNSFSDYLLSLDHLENLETLDLSNTSLPDFPLSLIEGSKNIKRLYLAYNHISSLPEGVLHQLENLEFLDLSANWFETLVPFGFQGLSHLKTLVLDKMPYLAKIEQHAFAGLTSLYDLSCQKNPKLSFIDVMAFRVKQDLERELTEGDSHPKKVHFGDNNLQYIEYGLLTWKDMEWLELYRNPWNCDCNLQWVSEYHQKRPSESAVLQDKDFQCMHPHIFAGVAVVDVNPEEMLCYSPAATVAGTVAIIVFAFLLFTFCSIIILNHMGMLPDWVRSYNIFGSGSTLPKYMRVNPKPSRARRMERLGASNDKEGPHPGDLEWDSADIGPT